MTRKDESRKSHWLHPSSKLSTCSFSQGRVSTKVNFSYEEPRMSTYGDQASKKLSNSSFRTERRWTFWRENKNTSLDRAPARISHTVESCKCLPLCTAQSTYNIQKISGTDVTHVISYYIWHTLNVSFFFNFKTNCDLTLGYCDTRYARYNVLVLKQAPQNEDIRRCGGTDPRIVTSKQQGRKWYI